MGSRRICPALISSLGLIILLPNIAAAQADDQQLRSTVSRLADSDAEARAAAIEKLSTIHDGRLAAFLKAYAEGSVYQWKGQLVLCRQMTADKDGAKLAPLSDPLTRQPILLDGKQQIVRAADLADVGPSLAERKALGEAVTLTDLWSNDFEERLAAVQKCGGSGNPKFLPPLAEVADSDAPERIRRAARESAALIRLSGNVPDLKPLDRRTAARQLAELRSARAVPKLQDLLRELDVAEAEHKPVDPLARQAYQQSIEEIEAYQKLVRGFDYVKNGLSRGSILILMALGLSIIYGLMRVINMAHGELMMIGAYATYVTQQMFVRHLPESYFNWFFVISLPVALLSAAIVGFLIEFLVVSGWLAAIVVALVALASAFLRGIYRTLIGLGETPAALPAGDAAAAAPGNRRLGERVRETLRLTWSGMRNRARTAGLYGRPLDTLLATWGVSLVLIQVVKQNFGYNIGVNSPTWLRGGVEIMQDMVLPTSRLFIFVLTAFCVVLIWALMRYTELGLRIRATMQDREMASALGVNTRRIDGYTFALGAGFAGLAGYALTLVGGVTPDMGQNYIVESFLVVVTGGVGKLMGAIWAGLGLGVLNKILEPSTGAVWGQVLILLGVILFIQRRPAGLFPPKGRLADAEA